MFKRKQPSIALTLFFRLKKKSIFSRFLFVFTRNLFVTFASIVSTYTNTHKVTFYFLCAFHNNKLKLKPILDNNFKRKWSSSERINNCKKKLLRFFVEKFVRHTRYI